MANRLVTTAWHEESIREENEYAENDEVFITGKMGIKDIAKELKVNHPLSLERINNKMSSKNS